LAAPISILVTGLLGFLVYWTILYRVRGLILSEVVCTFALGVCILEFFRWKGFVTYEFTLPPLMYGTIKLAGTNIDCQRLLIVAIAFIFLLLMYLFSRHTRIGLSFKGMAQNERLAMSFGIDTDLMASLSVAMGSAMAGIASLMILPLGIISIDTGYDILLVAVAVSVVGGLGNNIGILGASILLGYLQAATNIFLSPKWMMVIYLFAIILVLAIRPSGLFGKFKEIEERV
jgi:branched-chain amino acid transport system permease protein